MLALIVIVSIGAITTVGQQTRDTFTSVAGSLPAGS